MTKLMESAPKLEPGRIDQLAALPIGSRIKVDPWSARAELLKNKAVALISPREKMAFEVTPFLPYLTRTSSPSASQAVDGTVAPGGSPNTETP